MMDLGVGDNPTSPYLDVQNRHMSLCPSQTLPVRPSISIQGYNPTCKLSQTTRETVMSERRGKRASRKLLTAVKMVQMGGEGGE